MIWSWLGLIHYQKWCLIQHLPCTIHEPWSFVWNGFRDLKDTQTSCCQYRRVKSASALEPREMALSQSSASYTLCDRKQVIYLLWLSFLGAVSGDKQQLPVGVTVKTSERVCEGIRCGRSALKHGAQGTEGGGAVSAPSASVHAVVCLPTCSHVQGVHTCDLYVK